MAEETTYAKVAEWNRRCNKTPAETGTDEYWEALENQAKRIEEELHELTEAIQNRDTTELFDALLDLDVVVSGGLYLSNGNYDGGIGAVLSNNNQKYTTNKRAAEIAAFSYLESGTEVEIHSVSDTNGWNNWNYYSIHRKSDDKIMKFPGHPTVDLTPYIPKVGE